MRCRTFFFLVPCLALFPFLPNKAAAWSPHADFVFHNGNVVTVDESFSTAAALAVKDGKIIAVGGGPEVLRHRGPDTRVIDLEGKTVIPGIQDSHIHFLNLGRDISRQADLTFAMSADDILDAVAKVKERVRPEPGEWLIGNRWDQYKYDRMITRSDLDRIAPENPVWLNRVYRGVAVNSRVFQLMGIEDNRPATWPDWWLEDPEDFTFEDRIYRERRTVPIDGETREPEVPTGVFLGVRGTRLVTERPPSPDFEDNVASIRDGVREMLALGVTAIVDPSSRWGEMMRLYQEAYNRGHLDLRVAAVYEGTFSSHSPERIREHLDNIKINNLGDGFLRWRGTKYYSDGGAGTRSAWVSESFDRWEEFEGEKNFGYPVVDDNELREAQYRAAIDHGWELHTHTAGDVAMRQAVDLYRKLIGEIRKKRPGADPRWSLIHTYFPIEEETRVLEEMAELGIIAAANPVFQWQEGIAFATNVGEARMARMQPFRSYIEAGVVVASGSDYGVTSHDPWLGIYALLTRRDQATGKVFGPEETVGIEDALRTYTINGAYLTHDDHWRGSLETGKAADLVVLDLDDLAELERNPELCFKMRDRVVLTMVDGKVRFEQK